MCHILFWFDFQQEEELKQRMMKFLHEGGLWVTQQIFAELHFKLRIL